VRIRRFDGAYRWFLNRAVPLPADDGQPVEWLGTSTDITERRRIEAERQRLFESEQRKSEQLATAIREAHHRIKNNLQAVTDLISLELDAAERAGGSESLRDSIERIQAISLVHDLLSRDTELELVDIQQLAERLVPTVLRACSRSATAIELNLSVPSRLLSSRKATALALVLNELISNAAKHAFPGRPAGTLQVGLADEGERLLLVVQDDGPGLPHGFDLDQHSNVGLQVARTLVEGNLRGRLSLQSQKGLRAEVRFDPREEESRR
jgi:two-component sensor histidine kinase